MALRLALAVALLNQLIHLFGQTKGHCKWYCIKTSKGGKGQYRKWFHIYIYIAQFILLYYIYIPPFIPSVTQGGMHEAFMVSHSGSAMTQICWASALWLLPKPLDHSWPDFKLERPAVFILPQFWGPSSGASGQDVERWQVEPIALIHCPLWDLGANSKPGSSCQWGGRCLLSEKLWESYKIQSRIYW